MRNELIKDGTGNHISLGKRKGSKIEFQYSKKWKKKKKKIENLSSEIIKIARVARLPEIKQTWMQRGNRRSKHRFPIRDTRYTHTHARVHAVCLASSRFLPFSPLIFLRFFHPPLPPPLFLHALNSEPELKRVETRRHCFTTANKNCSVILRRGDALKYKMNTRVVCAGNSWFVLFFFFFSKAKWLETKCTGNKDNCRSELDINPLEK